jgi:hypothetical protein
MISGLSSSQVAQPQHPNRLAAKKPVASPKADKVQFGRETEEENKPEAAPQQPKKPLGVLERLVNRIIQFIDRVQKSVEEFLKNLSEHLKKSQEQMSAQLAAQQAETEEQRPAQDKQSTDEAPVDKEADKEVPNAEKAKKK